MCATYSPLLSNVSAQWTVFVLQGEFVARLYDGNSPKVKDVTLQPETGSQLSYNRATATPRQPRTAVPTRSRRDLLSGRSPRPQRTRRRREDHLAMLLPLAPQPFTAFADRDMLPSERRAFVYTPIAHTFSDAGGCTTVRPCRSSTAYRPTPMTCSFQQWRSRESPRGSAGRQGRPLRAGRALAVCVSAGVRRRRNRA